MNLESVVKRILIREPFYGIFLLGLQRYYSKDIETAGVARRGINTELIVNKEWFEALDDETAIGVIIHELSHILFGHILLEKEYDDHLWLNYSCDLETNSYISVLQKDPYFYPQKFKMPLKQGTKWYYENLKEYAQKAGYKVIPTPGGGSHKNWKDFADLSDAEKELVKQQIDSQAKHAAEETTKQHGNIPGQYKEYIDRLFKNRESVFNWKSYFRRVVGNSIESFLKSTRYRPSRRFKGQPGTILKFKPKVLVAVDTSGSVSNEELSDFFTEIHHLYKSGITVDVIEFDTTITNKFTYKGQQNITIAGRGGTVITEAWNYYGEHPEYSTFVVFTDGGLDINHLKHYNNVIWIISSSGLKQDYPGKTIYIPKWN